MCQKCVRRAKNLKPRRTLTAGKVRSFMSASGKYLCVPLYADNADNYFVEAMVYLGQRRRTNNRIYRRHSR